MGLKVWLPLNGDLTQQGASGVSMINSNATVNTSGKIGSCYYFNASSYLYENTYDWTNFNTSQFSLCCWYKQPSPVASGNSQIICIGTNSGWNNIRIGLLRRTSSGYPMFSVSNGSSAVQYNCTATTFSFDTWNHIVCTYDNGTIKIYLNGTLDKTYTTTIVPVLNSSQHLGVGAASNGAEKLTGYLNDVRIYDHCLSAAEVREISQGLILHYKLDSEYFMPTINQLAEKSDHFSGWGSYGFGGHGQTTIANISPALSGEVGQVINKDSGNYDGEIATGVSGYQLNKNDTITFSAYVKGNGNTIGKTGYIWIYKSNGTNTISTGTSFIMTSDWQRVKHTITWTYDNPSTGSTSCYVRCNRAQNESFYISNCQLEYGTVATGFTNTSRIEGQIQDSSGYGYNGTINSNPTISSITSRYQYSMSFDGVDDCIIVPYNTICPENIFTFNLWFKKDALGSKSYETLFGGPSGFEMDTRSGAATSLSLYMASARSGNRNSVTSLSLGNWYMVTMTRDGTKEKYYINGIFQSEIDAKAMPNGTYRIGAWSNNTGQNFYGLISDFRIYCTALDADAIRQLYEVGAKVDNQHNIHTFELNENGSNKLTKTGILKDYIVEPFLTLPDGSKWQLLLYHYVDGGANLFTQAKAPYCNEFGLYSRLQYADNFTYDNKYEFYVLQDDIEYRWTQTNKPTAASPSGFTAISGYTNAVQGLVKPTSLTQTYFGYNSWWGACGSWTSYSTGGKTGIPGFGAHSAAGMCTKYLALYARVTDFNAKIANLSALTNNFIEL